MAESDNTSSDSDAAALAEWEAMLAKDKPEAEQVVDDKAQDQQPIRSLSQEEIDNLLGFKMSTDEDVKNKGIRAMLDKALQSYERLPMLEIVFDRFVRILSTSIRSFTSETVDIDIRSISSLRFGSYINSIPMPALLTVFKAVEWENFGLITADGSLIYSLVDVLFGGRKIYRPIKFEGRPYTTIEQGIVRQLSDIILADLGAAFDPLSPATFSFERIETNPRFATISRPGDAAILLQLRVEMEERGGKIEILFPYVTLDPIRNLLLQVFMGEKFGKDSDWENHLEYEVYNTPITVEAVLQNKPALMQDIMRLKVGSTIIMEDAPDDDVILICEGNKMLSGKLGRVGNKIAVSVNNTLNKKMKEGSS
jgi:flagellar motor switch protein FliM